MSRDVKLISGRVQDASCMLHVRFDQGCDDRDRKRKLCELKGKHQEQLNCYPRKISLESESELQNVRVAIVRYQEQGKTWH